MKILKKTSVFIYFSLIEVLQGRTPKNMLADWFLLLKRFDSFWHKMKYTPFFLLLVQGIISD